MATAPAYSPAASWICAPKTPSPYAIFPLAATLITCCRHLEEVQELLVMAESADTANIPDGLSQPKELKLREVHLTAIDAAKTKIAARAARRMPGRRPGLTRRWQSARPRR
jgi:hypothetical protein